MALQNTPPISLKDIQNELKGTTAGNYTLTEAINDSGQTGVFDSILDFLGYTAGTPTPTPTATITPTPTSTPTPTPTLTPTPTNTPVNNFQYVGYSATSSTEACNSFNGGSLYEETNYYYTNASKTTFAPDGYYKWINFDLNLEYYFLIQNGQVVSTTLCF